jgi:hypothetical protein
MLEYWGRVKKSCVRTTTGMKRDLQVGTTKFTACLEIESETDIIPTAFSLSSYKKVAQISTTS